MSPDAPRRQELRGTPRLRSNDLPPDTLILLRGGPQEVADLVASAADSGERYGLDGEPFYGLSVTAVLDDDVADLLAQLPLRAYRQYHRMTAGDLYAAGFRVWATFLQSSPLRRAARRTHGCPSQALSCRRRPAPPQSELRHGRLTRRWAR